VSAGTDRASFDFARRKARGRLAAMQGVMRFRWCAVAILAAVAARFAQAEMAWLEPETTRATPGATIVLTLNVSDSFRGSSTALPASRVDATRVALAGNLSATAPWTPASGVLRSSVTLTRPGVAVLELRLKPEARSISRSEVDRYLIALHADENIEAAWEQIPPPKPWQEIRTAVLKTYVRVGTPTPTEQAWLDSSGSGLDMVPMSDPTDAPSNAPFKVRVTRDGKSAAGVAVEFLSDGETREHVTFTDEAGAASAPLDRNGAWLIRCFDVRRVSAGNHDWETDAVTLMVVTSR
jgi:hypothetical protein